MVDAELRMTVFTDNPPARGEEPSSRALSAAVSAVQPHRRRHGDKILSYIKSETLGSGERNQEVEEENVEKEEGGPYGQLQQGKLNFLIMHCYDFECEGFLSLAKAGQKDSSPLQFGFFQPQPSGTI